MYVPTLRVEPIEIPVVINQGSVKVPDQPQLTNAIIFGIEVLTDNDISRSPETGGTMMANADFLAANLNLYQGSDQKGQNIPLPRLHEMQNTSDPFTRSPFEWKQISISWTKSSIEIPNGNFTASGVCVLLVRYAYPEDFGFNTVDEYFNYMAKNMYGRLPIPVANRS